MKTREEINEKIKDLDEQIARNAKKIETAIKERYRMDWLTLLQANRRRLRDLRDILDWVLH